MTGKVEPTKSCKITEAALRRPRRRIVILALFMPIGIVVALAVANLNTPGNLGPLFCPGLAMLAILEASVFFTSSQIFRRMRESTLTVTPEGLERHGGRFSEKINYTEIREVEIVEFPTGELAALNLKLVNQKAVSMQGFECLPFVAQQLEQAVPDPAMVRRKRIKIDWDQPVLFIALLSLFLVAILALNFLGGDFFQVLRIVFFFSYGLYSLVSRPLTRQLGRRFQRFEILLGAFLLVLSILQAGLLASEQFLDG